MGRIAFLLAAGISLSGALIHFAAPLLGPEWYAVLRAPGGTLVVGWLMLACALYALAGAGVLHWLPFAQMVQGTVAAVCLMRGLLVLPYLYKFPERVWTFGAVASAVWFAAGLAFLVGILKSGNAAQAPAAAPPDAQASGV